MDAVLNWLWQGIAVAAAAALLLRLLDRARAQTRYIVCAVALLAVATLPLMPPLRDASVRALARPSPPAAELAAPSTQSSAIEPSAVLSVPDAWWTSTAFALVAWAAWLVFHTAHASLAVVRVRRARSRVQPVAPDVQRGFPAWMQVRETGRRPRLVVSADIRAAAVLGAGRPLIALSSSLFERLTDQEIDRLIMHEWAHVQRRDDWAALVQLAARTIAGWHPAYRWIERRLQVEREIACDEAVVAITGSAKAYAACLVKLASLVPPRVEPPMTLAALSAPRLSTRVARIVSPSGTTSRLRTTAVTTIGMASLMSLTIALGTVDGIVISRAVASPANAAQLSAFNEAANVGELRTAAPPSPTLRASTATPTAPRTSATPSEAAAAVIEQAHSAEPLPQPAPVVQQPHPTPESPIAPLPMLDRDPSHGHPILLSASVDLPASAPAAAETGTPWGAAADAGVALGRGSKKAGVATAGFFSRVGRRIAGSF